jgi:uncharacterized protein GlcG (DUF336 family)
MLSRAKTARAAALALTAAASFVVPAVAHSQLLDSKVVSLQAAKTMAVAAEAEAKKHGWSVAVAVVDVSGNLIVFDRMDDVQIGSVDVAIQKARTAARFRRPTKALADALAANGNGILSVRDAVAVAGGIPIVADGKVIGAVGCSGMTSDQDATAAQAGVDALQH